MSGHLLAQKSPLLDGVEPHVVSALLSNGRCRDYAANEPIVRPPRPGFGLLFVFCGSAKIFYEDPDGRQVLTRLLRAGEVALGCPGDDPHELVEALEPSQAMVVGKAELDAALAASHRLSLNVLRQAGGQLHQLGASVRSFAFCSVEERLAELLSSLAQRYGRKLGHGVRIELPLTQDSLADMLGVGRRSVTRALQPWTQSGALLKKDGRFTLMGPVPGRPHSRSDEARAAAP